MLRALILHWCRYLAWVALLLLGCGHGDELAKLQAMRGTVERDVASKQGAWGRAAVGASFVVGDGVRTAKAATAELKLSDGSGLTLQEKSLLRFLASPPGKKSRGLALEAGEVELDVGASGLEIETPAGPATLDPGTRVRLRKTEQGTRFSVEIGAAHLTDLHRDLKPGEQIEIGIGRAVIEPSAPTPAPSALPPSAPSARPADSVQASADSRTRGPDVVDLPATAGDSLIVHDPHPPTVVGFATPGCAGLAVLEVGTKRRETVGAGRVTASFAAGAQRYRLRCDAEAAPFAEGMVTVLPDAGNRRLASAAPANRIDADGRRYTILYQSLLPKVSVRWPNPPAGGPFALFVRSQGKGQKQLSAGGPSYALPAGTLNEGTHELWFSAGSEQSRKTTVVVQFDNAAPTASISSPPERGFAAGSTVTAAGTALPGWTVSVAGRDLAQDAQQRFSGEVGAPGDASALAIRFAHPQRGVHYYLRRPSR
ncbi:MAG TPA: FecR family protein [Polyangiaceae bacterium]|nr:FecR family protein [Polyangiaceae bacterium]